MLFYPLWVLLWQFSCELAVLPPPVSVNKGWLKPRCEKCIEHGFWWHRDYQGCVFVTVWMHHEEKKIPLSYLNVIWEPVSESVNRWYYTLLLQLIQTNKILSSIYTFLSCSFPFNFLHVPSVFVPPLLFSFLLSSLLSPILLFPSPALIRLFFVSESRPPSCQLRQD